MALLCNYFDFLLLQISVYESIPVSGGPPTINVKGLFTT